MNTLVQSVSELPPPTRYITTHNNVGHSIFATAPPLQYHRIGPQGKIGGAARSWAAESVPVQVRNDADLKAYFDTDGIASYTKKAISIDAGVTLIVIDFLPSGRSQMHQTVSLDFFVCLNGVLELELDSGETKTVRPGDHIIQRATMHRWFNPSDSDSARLVLVTVGAAPFDVAGKPMREVFLPPSPENDA